MMQGNSVSLHRRSPVCLTLAFWIISAFEPSLGLVQKNAHTKGESAAPEDHFDAAQTFQIAGDFGRAAAEYRRGISIALQRLGNLKFANGDNAGGLETLKKAVHTDAGNIDAQIDLGIAYFRGGDYNRAKECVQSVLKSEGDNFRALNLLGKIDFMQGNFESAANELQAALAITPDFDVAYSLALADLQLKKLPQATVLFDEMRASLADTPELHTLLGQAYRQTGYPGLAVEQFKNALKLDSAFPHAHAYLGVTYFTMGGKQNFDLAREQFRLELAKAPRDYSSLYYLGMIELNEHQLEQAEESLQEAHRTSADDPGPLLLLGRLYSEQRKSSTAIAVLRQAISLLSSGTAPTSQIRLAHEMLSKAYISDGQTAEGEQELAAAKLSGATEAGGTGKTSPQETIPGPPAATSQELRSMLMEKERKPEGPAASEAQYVNAISKLLGNAYNNLGVMDARNSLYKDAAEEFKQAELWDSSIPQLDRNFALAAFRAQLYSDAIGPLDRLVHNSPADQNLRQMLALSYYMTNRFTDSAAAFRPIVDSLPQNPGLLLSAGIAFVKGGDTSTAERLFARAFESGNETPEIHVLLGQAYADQSDTQQASAEFKRALDLNPRLPEAHYYLGMLLFKKGALDEAAKQFQSELELNAQHPQSLYQLAYIRLQQHQPSDATRLLAEVIKQQPANSDAHYQLGKALLEQGDVSAATRELETSIQLHPTDYAYFQLSNAYTRNGRTDDAKRALESFEKLKPKNVAVP
jgi:tetratricopeptide (TPR) repeat protein